MVNTIKKLKNFGKVTPFLICAISLMLFLNCKENPVSNASKPFEWDEETIEQALKADFIRWANDPNVNTEYTKYGVIYTGKALNYLALVTFHDSGNSMPEVTNRVIAQLKYVISGAKEPCCRGVIAGWADNSLAQSITLAKFTDRIWSQFNKEEKAKFDLLMKSLAIAGNYCQNSKNNISRGLYQSYGWSKRWNPNHQEGYVGVMVAANIYFGGSEMVNKIFNDFDYDKHIKDINDAGFINIVSCWHATGKELMEKGGEDSAGGTTMGVKIPFTYESLAGFGELEFEPYLLYRDLATRMFQHKVTSKECDGESYIIDGTTSPYEGQLGMCYEFRTVDASGCRSSAGYCFDGFMNNMLTLASLHAFGLLPDSDEHKSLIAQLKVGYSDLKYKLQHGYRARKNGKFTEEYEKNMEMLGYRFIDDIYNVHKERL